MKNERTRTIVLLAAFAVGSTFIFFTNTPAQLGYGVTVGCCIASFVFGSTIYLVARKQFLAKKAAEAARSKTL